MALDGFDSFGAARGAILADVWSAQSLFTQHNGAIERAAMQSERRATARFVEAATPDEAARAGPLFYRRTLSDAEVEDFVARLEERWGVRDGWVPIGGLLPEPHESREFRASEFEKYFGEDGLRDILLERGASRAFEWREWGRSTLVDLSEVQMSYTGAEGVWCDNPMQWVAYASHEDSLLLGGWLADEVRRRWPEWEKYLWRPWW